MSVQSTRLNVDHPQPNRRDFIRIASAGAAGLATAHFAGSLAGAATESKRLTGTILRPAKHLIFLHLAGGPSQIDTFDPKPLAPAEYRNFDPACQTSIPGVMISENLPRLAARLQDVSLIRALHHDGPATHAAGHTRIDPFLSNSQTDVRSNESRSRQSPAELMLGQLSGARLSNNPASDNDVQLPQFDDLRAPYRSPIQEQVELELRPSDSRGLAYGTHQLGLDCWRARILIERGARVVTIQQFSTVYDQITWDMHANAGRLNSTHDDYRQTLCPQLDQALSALLDDLRATGLIQETVVVAVGEMGRTSRINAYGGRDHQSTVWTGLIAGGPVRGGQAIGSSDAIGAEPFERPASTAEFGATICRAIGIAPTRGADSFEVPENTCKAINELF